MHVATCVITLQLYAIRSLKEKRGVLKFLIHRLPKQFNIAVAETGNHDVWQSATISLVTVGNDAGRLHATLEKSVSWIQKNRPDLVIEDYSIEFR